MEWSDRMSFNLGVVGSREGEPQGRRGVGVTEWAGVSATAAGGQLQGRQCLEGLAGPPLEPGRPDPRLVSYWLFYK